jgi:hypothetical protein
MDIKRKIIMYYLCCFLAGSRLFASVPEEPQAERDNPISASRKEAQERVQRNREQREWEERFKQLQRDIEKDNRRARALYRSIYKLLVTSPRRTTRERGQRIWERGVKAREHARDQRERKKRAKERRRQQEEREWKER